MYSVRTSIKIIPGKHKATCLAEVGRINQKRQTKIILIHTSVNVTAMSGLARLAVSKFC